MTASSHGLDASRILCQQVSILGEYAICEVGDKIGLSVLQFQALNLYCPECSKM